MRTEQAEALLDLARKILALEHDERPPPKERLDWARAILAANALWPKKEPA